MLTLILLIVPNKEVIYLFFPFQVNLFRFPLKKKVNLFGPLTKFRNFLFSKVSVANPKVSKLAGKSQSGKLMKVMKIKR